MKHYSFLFFPLPFKDVRTIRIGSYIKHRHNLVTFDAIKFYIEKKTMLNYELQSETFLNLKICYLK